MIINDGGHSESCTLENHCMQLLWKPIQARFYSTKDLETQQLRQRSPRPSVPTWSHFLFFFWLIKTRFCGLIIGFIYNLIYIL